ncbi:MAG: acetylxylan esterase [Verrucomicrobiota bacterium]
MSKLQQVPKMDWGVRTGSVQEVYYEGEPYRGKPTRIFAYLGRPEGKGPFPAMVLVHGGGGKAFPDWVKHWVKQGFVALAMDTAGCGPAGLLPDGGPDQNDSTKFRDFQNGEINEMWTYHAVAAVIRGHSLLASLPEVDAHRIGLTGISWGGYLTCIVAGLDHRFKVAVPVYGCGFLGESSYWTRTSLVKMNPDSRERWLHNFDPSQYLAGVSCPILFLNGTSDFAYWLDSYRASYQLVSPKFRNVCVVVNLPHGHIWTFKEVDQFVGHQLRHGPPSPRLALQTTSENEVKSKAIPPTRLKEAFLNFTRDSGELPKRHWESRPAILHSGVISARLPFPSPQAWFLSAIDEDGLRVSTEHEELER